MKRSFDVLAVLHPTKASPRVVDADLVGDSDLLQGVLELVVFAHLVPGDRDLMFVEDAELHRYAAAWIVYSSEY